MLLIVGKVAVDFKIVTKKSFTDQKSAIKKSEAYIIKRDQENEKSPLRVLKNYLILKPQPRY